ncbi:MAG: hypothetical protein KZQ96_19840 [Candidatus Thiodiazotropha sp. (ex Lucinoma borealis)]|nr:hypothetical protein [Candidatus Thiodiazotropha sp. (ex Lucinoma borealis)]
MKEQRIQMVQAVVAEYLAGAGAFDILFGDNFSALLDHVHDHLPDNNPDILAEEELCALSAILALGPGHDGVPPEGLREHFFEIARKYARGNPERTAELAVAFGCGKWREVGQHNGCWQGEWGNAVITLVGAIRHFVKAANIWMAERVKRYPGRGFWSSAEGNMLMQADAGYLAVRVMRPYTTWRIGHGQVLEIDSMDDGMEYRVRDTANEGVDLEGCLLPGARLVFGTGATPCVLSCEHSKVGERVLEPGTRIVALARDGESWISFPDVPSGAKAPRITLNPGMTSTISGPMSLQVWECSCGHEKCAERHRLEAWEPDERITLRSFLASAVKGPEPAIKVGSFSAGMYYPMLAQDGGANALRVRAGPVEYTLCANPKCNSPAEGRRYEGDSCPTCRTHFNPADTYKKAFNYLMVVDDYGTYQRQPRMQCSGESYESERKIKCGNLYSVSYEQCPICEHRPRLRRPTMVWVRNFTRRVGDDECSRIGTTDDPDAGSSDSDL